MDCLATLTIDVVTLIICDNKNTERPQLRSFDSVKFLKPEEPTTSWFPTTTPPSTSELLVVLTKPRNKLSKIIAMYLPLAIHCTVDSYTLYIQPQISGEMCLYSLIHSGSR